MSNLEIVPDDFLLWHCPACGEPRAKGWCACEAAPGEYCPDCGCTGAMLCLQVGPGISRSWLRCHRCGKDRPV